MNPAAAPQARVISVEDVQSRADTRQIPINQVGIKDINHPVKVKDRSAGEQHTVANFNMYVNLPHNFKGTHMSRFVEILHREREISVESFGSLLAEMTERLEADSGHIEMSFPYFVMKKAPVSGVESYMDYHATLIGKRVNGETSMWVRVVVPVTSLCPCSKKISERGAHNQRSHVTISAQAARAHVDRGAHRDRGERSVVRAVRDPQASRREVRDRARLRQSEVRRRHGARRRRATERRAARRRVRGRVGKFRVHPQSFRLRADRARQGRGFQSA